MNPVFAAMQFARHVHEGQRRKYTGCPYFDHLAEVAGLVASAQTYDKEYDWKGDMLSVAWLHDCIEDQGVARNQLAQMFGWEIARGVALLSDLETGNRAERKRQSRERLAGAPGWVQTIKCADLISNTSSIVQHDPKFAEVYLAEKRALLAVLTKADPGLHQLASHLSEAA